MDLFKEHLTTIQTGRELDDLMKYDSKDVMKSVVDRLENLNSIGIFRPQRPPFDPASTIWRYDIKALSTNEKKLFVSFILGDLIFRFESLNCNNFLSSFILKAYAAKA